MLSSSGKFAAVALTTNVALADVELLPLLVCNAPTGSVLINVHWLGETQLGWTPPVPTAPPLTRDVVPAAALTLYVVPAEHTPTTFTLTVQELPAGIAPPVNTMLEPPALAVSVPPHVVIALPETTMPLGNVSVNGAVRLAATPSELFKVIVRVETPFEVIVAGLKALLSVGATTGRALTVRVATAGAVLLPLLVCNEPAANALK